MQFSFSRFRLVCDRFRIEKNLIIDLESKKKLVNRFRIEKNLKIDLESKKNLIIDLGKKKQLKNRFRIEKGLENRFRIEKKNLWINLDRLRWVWRLRGLLSDFVWCG